MKGVTVRVRRLGCGFGSRCLAVQPPETLGGCGDFLDIVAFEEVAGAKLPGKFVLDLLVAAGVFAEACENDVTGKGRG